MNTYRYFHKGARLHIRLPVGWDGFEGERAVIYEVLRRVTNGWQCMNVADGTLCSFSDTNTVKFDIEKRLNLEVSASHLTPAAVIESGIDWHSLSEDQQKLARARANAVDVLRERHGNEPHPRKLLEAFAQEIKGQEGYPKRVSRGGLVRWCKLYPPSGMSPIALRNKPHPVGPQFDQKVADIVDGVIDRCYKRRNPLSVADIHILIERRINRRNAHYADAGTSISRFLKTPSYPTIARYIIAMDAEEIVRRQEGIKAAEDKFKIFKKAPLPRRAGALVAIDHTTIDLHVVDEHGTYLGRPRLTTVQCVLSGVIMGFHLTFHDISAASVVAAMKHAFMPKGSMRDQFGELLYHEHEVHGVPLALLFDNGSEAHAGAVEAACEGLGILYIEYTPTKRPRFKGKIERLFRTLNSVLFHRLKGGIRHRAGSKPEFDPKNDARIEFRDLHFLVTKFVVDVHPYRFQKALGDQPISIWRRDHKDLPPRLPQNPAAFDVLVGGIVTRKLRERGIEFMGGFYGTNEELRPLRVADAGKNSTFECRYDPNDLTALHVLSPRDGYIRATTADEHLVGATKSEAQAFLSRRADHKRQSERISRPRLAELIEAREKAESRKDDQRRARRKAEAMARRRRPDGAANEATAERSISTGVSRVIPTDPPANDDRHIDDNAPDFVQQRASLMPTASIFSDAGSETTDEDLEAFRRKLAQSGVK